MKLLFSLLLAIFALTVFSKDKKGKNDDVEKFLDEKAMDQQTYEQSLVLNLDEAVEKLEKQEERRKKGKTPKEVKWEESSELVEKKVEKIPQSSEQLYVKGKKGQDFSWSDVLKPHRQNRDHRNAHSHVHIDNNGYYGRDGQGHPVIPVVLRDDSLNKFPGVTFVTSLFTQTLTFISATSVTQSQTATGFTTVSVTIPVTTSIGTSQSNSGAVISCIPAFLVGFMLFA